MPRSRALIVSALNVEAQAILSFFDDVHLKSTPDGLSYMTGHRKIFSTKLGETLKDSWTFFIATPTGAGNIEISRALHQMIPECDPHLVALIGCAGGFPNRVETFDVVVAPRVDYIARTKVGERTQLRPLQETCSNVFIDHCRNVQLLDLWHQYLLPDISNAPINVFFDPIVSGETVLTNSRSSFFRSAQTASPRAVAIEMEGYGFLSACRDYRVETAVIQGISDLLDDKNAPDTNGKTPDASLNKAQFKATRHAAALFFATLDFANANAFRKHVKVARKDVTEVSMILDGEMHDVPEIQADLFELFKKYGIRNFSFKPANSVRVGFEADARAMRIYEALFAAGIVENLGGFRLLTFAVKDKNFDDRQFAPILARIEKLRGSSIEEALQIIRMEAWQETFPDHTAIIVSALQQQREQNRKLAARRGGRILYPVADSSLEDAQLTSFIGESAAPVILLTNARELRDELNQWTPKPAESKLLSSFMGNSLLDREIALDTLLAYSAQRLFYVWPGLGTLQHVSGLYEKSFINGCIAEWQMMRDISGPSILQLLNQETWGRLGRGQIRDAMAGQPATLAKSIDILALTCRILSQNHLPVRGCIIPSLYVLTFNGSIAGDGVVERMLLTGMAGDLSKVAAETDMTLRAVQSAVRGDLLPYRAAAAIASELDRGILKNTKLTVSTAALDADQAARRRREAVSLEGSGGRYLMP
jgi:nucleoside phosphorylase